MSKVTSVCLLSNSPFTLLNFRMELIVACRAAGIAVYVVCPESCTLMNSEETRQGFKQLGVEHHHVTLDRSGVNPITEIRSFFRLVKILRNLSPDLLINYTVKANIYGSLAGTLARVPRVFSNITGVGSSLVSGGFVSYIVSSLYKLCLGLNSVVFFQNSDDREFFTDRHMLRNTRVVMLPGSGVDTSRYKRQIPISTEPSFLFVGRLLKSKGIREFVLASQIVAEQVPGICFTVVGETDENPDSLSDSEIKRLQAESSVRFVGRTSDVFKYLCNHSVFVLPSYREGTPKAVLEAMSCSMAIITTDAPGCRETVEEGENGFLVPVGDAAAIAEAMFLFIQNGTTISGFSKRSRIIACEKFDVSIVVEKVMQEF